MNDMHTSLVVDLSGNLVRRAKHYTRSMNRFSRQGRRSMARLARGARALGRGMEGLTGRYTQFAVGAGAAFVSARAVMQSAGLDKQLIMVQQTAGATDEQVKQLRASLFEMAQQTGQSVDDLLSGFNDLVQSGQSWSQALKTIKAINPTLTVTGAKAQTLASGLTVAAQAFEFDLSKPKLATKLLDQMTVAGRLGNAELEDLSGIFADIGKNAKTAGLEFAGTLGFVEQLSLIEKNPARLSTLARSTLRLFTNGRYQKMAHEATGVDFFNAQEQRRSVFAVLDDIAAKYKQLKTDKQRSQFIQDAFGKTDQDTIKGLRTLLSGDTLAQAQTMTKQIKSASGTIAKDLPGAMQNAVDQTQRLKNALREAGDDFAQPINDAIGHAIQYALDQKNLSGKELLAGGAAAGLGGLAILKFGGRALSRIGGTAGGIAMGKALEETTGTTPVFVTNWPAGGMPLINGPDRLKNTSRFTRLKTLIAKERGLSARLSGQLGGGWKGGLAKAGFLAMAGGAGWQAGSWINDEFVEGTDFGHALGKGIAEVLSFFGNDTAQAAVKADEQASKVHVKIDVAADRDLKTKVHSTQSRNASTQIDHGAAAQGAF